MAIIKDLDGNEIRVTLTAESTLKFLELESWEYVEYSDEVPDEVVQWICDTQKEILKNDIRLRDRTPLRSFVGFVLFLTWLGGTLYCCYHGAEAWFQNRFAEKQLNDWKLSQQEVPRETDLHFPGVRHIGADRQIESLPPVETMTPEQELKKISMMFKILADKYAPLKDKDVIPLKVFQKINTRFTDASHVKKDWAGYCEQVKYDNGLTIGMGIVIDINEWLKPLIDYWRREELVFHEYGHCILDLEHDDGEITLNGETIPRSVMNHTMFKGTIYLRYREYYLTELFSHLREKVRDKHAPTRHEPIAETPGEGQYYYEEDDK